jgi:hypothetical protein
MRLGYALEGTRYAATEKTSRHEGITQAAPTVARLRRLNLAIAKDERLWPDGEYRRASDQIPPPIPPCTTPVASKLRKKPRFVLALIDRGPHTPAFVTAKPPEERREDHLPSINCLAALSKNQRRIELAQISRVVPP